MGFVHGYQPTIRQRNAKDVTGEIIQDCIFARSVWFAVRAPLSTPDPMWDLLEEFGMALLQGRSEPFGNHP
jgi:hypothetical protein